MRIVSVRAEPWTHALRAPFAVARRTALEAQNVRITVETEDGSVTGYGESAPVGYVTGESVATVLDAVNAVSADFVDLSTDRLQPLWNLAGRLLPESRAARAGLEMALCDAWGKHWGLPLWQAFGGAEGVLVTDLTIPIVSCEEAVALASAAVGEGFRHLKIKVGDSQGHEADLERIERVVQTAPGVALRIDANQAFDADLAVAFTEKILRLGARIEMIEQPVPHDDWSGLKYVRDHIDVPVFADEAARDVSDVVRLIREEVVDGINVKLMKSGPAGALRIIEVCRATGTKLMLGCMLESELGISAAAQIAAGTGAFDFLDLDSHRLLAPVADLSGGFTCTGDVLDVRDSGPGWGTTLPVQFPAETRQSGTIGPNKSTNI